MSPSPRMGKQIVIDKRAKGRAPSGFVRRESAHGGDFSAIDDEHRRYKFENEVDEEEMSIERRDRISRRENK